MDGPLLFHLLMHFLLVLSMTLLSFTQNVSLFFALGVGRNRVSEVNYQKVKKKVIFWGLHVAERGFLPILGSKLENSLIPPLFSVAMLGHF